MHMHHASAFSRVLYGTRELLGTYLIHPTQAPRIASSSPLPSFEGFDVTTLGTSSAIPTPTRGVSSTAIRIEGETWLIDAGEGTQLQLLKSHLSASRISRIFITHMHGDHIFGLPGLLCSIAATRGAHASEPIHIVGPPGIRAFVRQSLHLSHTLFELNLQIEEIYPQRPREIITVLDNKEFVVSAGALFHRVPCLGYVFHERDSKPQIDMAKVAALHVKPGPVLKQLKNGHSITLPSGQIIRPRDVLLPGRKGRKVVVLGDTADSSSLTEVARDADLLLHECTLPLALQSEARIRGHSTAGMAGAFARQIRAKHLLLTHFSPRFTTVADYAGLAAEARSAFCSSNVLLAQDFLTVSLARHAAGSAESVDDDDKMFAKQAHAGDDLDVPDEFL